MNIKKEKKIIHHAWGVVALLLVVMVGGILTELSAAKGSALYYGSSVLTLLAFAGASGYCAHTFTELEKLG